MRLEVRALLAHWCGCTLVCLPAVMLAHWLATPLSQGLLREVPEFSTTKYQDLLVSEYWKSLVENTEVEAGNGGPIV